MFYEIKWEILPPNVQKVIMLLIHRKQNERGLSLGPFGMGINRESFKLVIEINLIFDLLIVYNNLDLYYTSYNFAKKKINM